MNCPLCDDLNGRHIQALRKQEHHEIIRLAGELNKHRDTCAVYNGFEVESLASQLFNLPVGKENHDNYNVTS